MDMSLLVQPGRDSEEASWHGESKLALLPCIPAVYIIYYLLSYRLILEHNVNVQIVHNNSSLSEVNVTLPPTPGPHSNHDHRDKSFEAFRVQQSDPRSNHDHN